MRKILVTLAVALALGAAPISASRAAAERDGQHDFDFLTGIWKLHLKRRLDPLTGSDKWVEFDGAGRYRAILGGKANLNEFEAEGPSGHIEGLTLRTYDPKTHLWSLFWANSKAGVLEPPQIGKFTNGQGEFYARDTLDDKPIWVRYVWSKITPNSVHFEQAFSADAGKSWEVNWVSDMTKTADAKLPVPPNSAPDSDPDGQHGFDGLVGGRWKFHLHRLNERLANSTSWTDFYGTGDCFPLWNGRANLDTIEVDSPSGKIEGLTLRLFDPKLRLWRLYWANAKDGKLDVPQIGRFENGHGDFYALDIQNDHSVLVRYDWTGMKSAAPHFEQAFSIDGGKSWEVNWITDQTRLGDVSKN